MVQKSSSPQNDDWDREGKIEVYWQGKPVTGGNTVGIERWRSELGELAATVSASLKLALYVAMRDLRGEQLSMVFALLHELDFLVNHGDSSCWGGTQAGVLQAMTSDLEVVFKLALTLPWDRAQHLRGPTSLTRWLERNHPLSPKPFSEGK
ncbi:hypothetical protein [Luteolibacter marinus]|uniref:hypothetical protein n=1 Tax=Luteolibacter marinus TaxID=2776705 RepID=UPI0018686760|nr:hypothetical protein [Luteolibacter marinus]